MKEKVQYLEEKAEEEKEEKEEAVAKHKAAEEEKEAAVAKHKAAEKEKEAALKAQERSEHQRILCEHKCDLVIGARIQAFLDIVGRPCDLDQEPLPSVEAFGIDKAADGSKGQAESAQ